MGKPPGSLTLRPTAMPASLCSVCITKVVDTPNGEIQPGHGTGFFLRDDEEKCWLVTNWHVLTGRRPDNPGQLLVGYPQSPSKIMFAVPMHVDGDFTKPIEMDLYDKKGMPKWIELPREAGLDLVALPFAEQSHQNIVTIQDFCRTDDRAFEPGTDLVIIGFPFQHDEDTPHPVWKKGMVASEPKFANFGIPQFLIDSSSKPGMSGSPIYRVSKGFRATKNVVDIVESYASGDDSALDKWQEINLKQMQDDTHVLDFVGIYSGATGDKKLLGLQFGRAMLSSLAHTLLSSKSMGENPFSPDKF